MRILALCREKIYSPNAIGPDREILQRVVAHLREEAIVKEISLLYPDENHDWSTQRWDVVLNMAQGLGVLNVLENWESSGTLVINSSLGIKNCFRINLYKHLHRLRVPTPKYWQISGMQIPAEAIEVMEQEGGWIKSLYHHSLGDVSFCDNEIDLRRYLNSHRQKNFILQQHVSGNLIKFYGTTSGFLSLRDMGETTSTCHHHQPSWEEVSRCREMPRSKEARRSNRGVLPCTSQVATTMLTPEMGISRQRQVSKWCELISNSIAIDIYGGDFVFSHTGKIFFIDFNDWPSFRSCVESSANNIFNLILKKIEDKIDRNWVWINPGMPQLNVALKEETLRKN